MSAWATVAAAVFAFGSMLVAGYAVKMVLRQIDQTDEAVAEATQGNLLNATALSETKAANGFTQRALDQTAETNVLAADALAATREANGLQLKAQEDARAQYEAERRARMELLEVTIDPIVVDRQVTGSVRFRNNGVVNARHVLVRCFVGRFVPSEDRLITPTGWQFGRDGRQPIPGGAEISPPCYWFMAPALTQDMFEAITTPVGAGLYLHAWVLYDDTYGSWETNICRHWRAPDTRIGNNANPQGNWLECQTPDYEGARGKRPPDLTIPLPRRLGQEQPQ